MDYGDFDAVVRKETLIPDCEKFGFTKEQVKLKLSPKFGFPKQSPGISEAPQALRYKKEGPYKRSPVR